MFEGHNGLVMPGDHLDISWQRPDTWPQLTPKGSLRSFSFAIGDAEVGPTLQLGLVSTLADEPLDWAHSIDPIHHHGSDQFRLLMGGGWSVANHRLAPRGFLFQEAGWIYQEHPDSAEPAWMLLLMADRRGLPATLRLQRDRGTVFDAGAEYGVPLDDEQPYPHPAGNKGIAAIATSSGACQRGYRTGSFDARPQVESGLLGDATAGPVVHLVSAAAGEVLLPRSRFDTEVMVVVAAGQCRVAGQSYGPGELRVQRAGVPFEVVAGEGGAQVTFIVADRRAAPQAEGEASVPAWWTGVAALQAQLQPRPGGSQGLSAAH